MTNLKMKQTRNLTTLMRWGQSTVECSRNWKLPWFTLKINKVHLEFSILLRTAPSACLCEKQRTNPSLISACFSFPCAHAHMRRDSREYRSSFEAADKSSTIRLPSKITCILCLRRVFVNNIPLLAEEVVHLIGKIRFNEELKSKAQTWIIGPIRTQTGSHSFAVLNFVIILRKSFHYSWLENRYSLSSTKN